jgi:hypothetical protein
LNPVLSQMNPAYNLPFYIFEIHFNVIVHLQLRLPSGLFPSGILYQKLYAFLFTPMRAVYPIHRILFDLIVLILFDEEYRV